MSDFSHLSKDEGGWGQGIFVSSRTRKVFSHERGIFLTSRRRKVLWTIFLSRSRELLHTRDFSFHLKEEGCLWTKERNKDGKRGIVHKRRARNLG